MTLWGSQFDSSIIIIMVCIHYSSDLQYSKATKEFGFFFQNAVFYSYPDQVKRPATYLAILGI
jgi:hypothetical protein